MNLAVRGLVAVVLLFDIYTIYQHLQIHRIRHKLADREELFRLISENAADMIAVVDADGHRLYNSPSYEKLLGYNLEELQSTSSFSQIHPDDLQRVQEAASEAHVKGVSRSIEYRMRHKDGTWRVLESTASTVRNEKGEIDKLIIVNRDVSERKHLQRQAEEFLRLAMLDPLTGLHNRRFCEERLTLEMSRSQRYERALTVLILDLDGLKQINDHYGHGAGDIALKTFAEGLNRSIRGSDLAVRMGGDEFVVLLPECRLGQVQGVLSRLHPLE